MDKERKSLRDYLDDIAYRLFWGPIVDFAQWLENADRRSNYAKQQARSAMGSEKPTKADRKHALEQGGADQLIWLICNDASRKQRRAAWERLKSLDHSAQPRAFGQSDDLVRQQTLNWISIAAKDKDIREEAKRSIPRDSAYGRPI